MLKRYQVLLEDWVADHIKDIAESYDLSFSEMLRCLLSTHIIELIEIRTKYKSNVNWEKHRQFVKAKGVAEMDSAQFHKALSKLYFETQKAIEYFYEHERVKKSA
ncbi:MAG: hypothetical protein V1727_00060 [Candidatus Omnitrophota bacterium]